MKDWEETRYEEDDLIIPMKKPNQSLLQKANDPAEVIEINARCFQVKEFYVDRIV